MLKNINPHVKKKGVWHNQQNTDILRQMWIHEPCKTCIYTHNRYRFNTGEVTDYILHRYPYLGLTQMS